MPTPQENTTAATEEQNSGRLSRLLSKVKAPLSKTKTMAVLLLLLLLAIIAAVWIPAGVVYTGIPPEDVDGIAAIIGNVLLAVVTILSLLWLASLVLWVLSLKKGGNWAFALLIVVIVSKITITIKFPDMEIPQEIDYVIAVLLLWFGVSVVFKLMEEWREDAKERMVQKLKNITGALADKATAPFKRFFGKVKDKMDNVGVGFKGLLSKAGGFAGRMKDAGKRPFLAIGEYYGKAKNRFGGKKPSVKDEGNTPIKQQETQKLEVGKTPEEPEVVLSTTDEGAKEEKADSTSKEKGLIGRAYSTLEEKYDEAKDAKVIKSVSEMATKGKDAVVSVGGEVVKKLKQAPSAAGDLVDATGKRIAPAWQSIKETAGKPFSRNNKQSGKDTPPNKDEGVKGKDAVDNESKKSWWRRFGKIGKK